MLATLQTTWGDWRPQESNCVAVGWSFFIDRRVFPALDAS